MEIKHGLNHLPRGGYLVNSNIGYIQFASPPETIKDTMMLPKKVPQIFVLPGLLFNVEKGIAIAELEFPIYYNHFLRGGKTLLICTKEQQIQLEIILQESVFGPRTIDLEPEFEFGHKSKGFPDMEAELKFFRGDRKLSDLVVFRNFKDVDENYSVFKFRTLEIVREHHKAFYIFDNRELIAEIPWEPTFNIIYDIGQALSEPFQAPEFGITCLGPSHGFDPEDNTSGFILWVSNRGIMIDPPVNSTEWLRKSNVNPKLIDHIILTHCHADHDAGTFQKILEEGMITIHSTPTIINSFLRKYAALTQLDQDELETLFYFKPITIEVPVIIEGGEFIFYYSLHAIPTIAFSLTYQNQSFLYTSDHLNHPESLEKLHATGCFPNKERYDFLKNFPLDYNIIYHEAGIPPLHTPISYLSTLPEEIQKRITVYHIAKKDFPKDTHLRIAQFGMEHTLYPPIDVPKHIEAIKILDVMSHVDLFSDLPLSKSKDFLSIVEDEFFSREDLIFEKGTAGDKFYIIVSGNISIQKSNSKEQTVLKKVFGEYEYFGEASLITGSPRAATIKAATEVRALTITKAKFLNFIQDTSLEDSFLNLQSSRTSNSWDVLKESSIFTNMTSFQKTQLETFFEKETVPKEEIITQEGKPAAKAAILINGEFSQFTKDGNKSRHLNNVGDFLGDVRSIVQEINSTYTIKAEKASEVYMLSKKGLQDFLKKNPGIYLKLLGEQTNL